MVRLLCALPVLAALAAYARLGGRLPAFIDLPSRAAVLAALRAARGRS